MSKTGPVCVQEIVAQYLIANGYEGLWHPDGECACLVGENGSGLAPYGSECAVLDCRPGYVIEGGCGKHNYHIGLRPEPKGER